MNRHLIEENANESHYSDRARSCRKMVFLFVLASLAAAPTPTWAQVPYTTLHWFDSTNQLAYPPAGRLLEASDGKLYGAASSNANANAGTIFRMNKDGTGYEQVHYFTAIPSDGANPQAEVIEGSEVAHALYGTTSGGGNGVGTVFTLNKDGSSYSVLYRFQTSGGDGQNPAAALLEGSDGLLYGTTQNGGSAGVGTVFTLDKGGGGYLVLHHFLTTGGSAKNPVAALIEGSDHILYGAAKVGGSTGNGSIFKLNKDGTGYAVVRDFVNGDGSGPVAALLEGDDLALYGTTQNSSFSAGGSVFKVAKNGSGYQALHIFLTGTDGGYPRATLVKDSGGVLYGTTEFGGKTGPGGGGPGIVFKINQDGLGYSILKSLTNAGAGINPQAGVILASDGALYGTTVTGGSTSNGTVFKLSTSGAGYSVVRSFPKFDDGHSPKAALSADADGVLYGTTATGGGTDQGTVFKLNTNGTGYALLRSFQAIDSGDARFPNGVIVASDGLLYGTSANGGIADNGVIFKLNRDGSGYSILTNFSPSNVLGRNPQAALLEGSDGALYGTAAGGGGADQGTLFKLNKNGTGFTVLHSFLGSSDGSYPYASLREGSDGALYGTTSGAGTVFKVNKNGTGYLVLRHFVNYLTDGGPPKTAVFKASNGTLYGTTETGGSDGAGTVYTLQEDGSLASVLHHFTFGGDGYNPSGPLVEGSDGALYGTTRTGGATFYGTVFKLNKDGTGYSIVRSFQNTNGFPEGGLLRATNDRLYGVTSLGGYGFGTVYQLAPNRPPVLRNVGAITPQDTLLDISFTDLLINASDPDGDTLTVTGISATSTNGGGVVLGADHVTYTPLPGYDGDDRFSYTVSDGHGLATTAYVLLLVSDGDVPPLNNVSITIKHGTVRIRFTGTPGDSYRIQRAHDASGPWTTLATLVAPPNGIISYTDPNPLPGGGIYRVQWL